ncbi:unnamed protein product, partial [Thlaspi arvense]
MNIYFSGSMKKMDEDYEYIGRLVSEIKWETFEDFIQGEKVSTPIAIVWYKDPREKMKNIKYVFQSNNEDMFELHSAGKVIGEIDVYLEHDCSEHIVGVTHYLPSSQGEDHNEGDDDTFGGNEREYDGHENDTRVDNKYCSAIRSSSNVYEVVEFECGYTLNLSTRQCACRHWDLTSIPCKHAICVLDDNAQSPVKYVSGYYYANVMKDTYKKNIKPVNGEKLWVKTWKTPVGIPEFRKPRRRPKNRDRKKEPFEDLKNSGKATRHGRTPRCSNCLQMGHIKTGCKNEKVVVEGPKNKRGRPRKLPSEVLKRPTKPRKRKTPPVSSSQPVLPTESSQPVPPTESSQPLQPSKSMFSYPATSSAPEPTTSSTQSIAQEKKPKRGRPLKITKTGPIPWDVGTLWCPYTDRVFEVINNRAYDTNPSASTPEPPI